MTVLVWDQVGDRRFETGVDRGVLYLPMGEAVPWNGLTSISEDTSREVKSYYIDGVKYLDHYVPGAYTAKLQAFTYPEELDELTGTSEYAPGVFLHDQRASLFHLSYRTLVGNDVDGVDHAYKIHIVYNVIAVATDGEFSTLSNEVNAQTFGWSLTGTPPTMFGARPTNHVSLHSDGLSPEKLVEVEALLYGSEDADPSLPSMVNLLAMLDVSS